ncbi:unnamed protein product [Arabis nemorensis]|uniref:Uncharacterized protein n=1 Tax=Arabis nemorensis TaxID=586526 RepID=A0A565AWN4_9BRAS|nr:unnamed protein product [Arabis nemorensis]
MLLTLETSHAINRRSISPVNHLGLEICKSRSSRCPLPPPSESVTPEIGLWLKAIAADLSVVTRNLTSTSLRPKQDPRFPEPCEPSSPPKLPYPPDPPPDPPDPSLVEVLRSSSLLTDPKNHHSIDLFPHLHPRGDLGQPLHPWPRYQGEASRSSKPCTFWAPPDINPPQSLLWWWSSTAPTFTMLPELNVRSTTVSRFITGSVIGPDCRGLGPYKGVFVDLETGCSLGSLSSLVAYIVLVISSLLLAMFRANFWLLELECKSRNAYSSVTRTKILAVLVEDKKKISVESESFPMVGATSLGSIVSKHHGLVRGSLYHSETFEFFCFRPVLGSYALVTDSPV